jgi:hypothetical protein
MEKVLLLVFTSALARGMRLYWLEV